MSLLGLQYRTVDSDSLFETRHGIRHVAELLQRIIDSFGVLLVRLSLIVQLPRCASKQLSTISIVSPQLFATEREKEA
jgi:hypothetical protein